MSNRMQASAHRLIKHFGGGVENNGALVRAGVSRLATMARVDYTPKERELFVDGSEKILVSAIGLTVPPDHEQDLVEYKGDRLRIVMPPLGPRPDGTVAYYELICLHQESF
jgi:hypothetical protein